jgi:hypothetical protein
MLVTASKKSKKTVKEFKCKQCSCVLESQSLLNFHINEYQEVIEYKCSVCTSKFVHKCTLEMHIKNYHKGKEDMQFNCNDSSFQGNGQIELNNHLSATHHKPSSRTEHSNDEHYLSCHSCGEKMHVKNGSYEAQKR